MEKFTQGDFKFALVIDAQEDFMLSTGALPVQGAEDIIPKINEYLKHLTLENGYMGVMFTADTHNEDDYPNSTEAIGDDDLGIPGFPPHCYQGTDGFKFAINPKNTNNKDGNFRRFILNKSVFNMWEEEGLTVRPLALEGEPVPYGGDQDRNDFFAALFANGIEDVEVVGVSADYCVKWAIDGLIARGFKVTLYDDLTAGIERDIHQVVQEEFAHEDVQVL